MYILWIQDLLGKFWYNFHIPEENLHIICFSEIINVVFIENEFIIYKFIYIRLCIEYQEVDLEIISDSCKQ